MQEKDAVTNEYFKDPERVADMLNVFIFKGQPVLEAYVESIDEFMEYLKNEENKVP